MQRVRSPATSLSSSRRTSAASSRACKRRCRQSCSSSRCRDRRATMVRRVYRDSRARPVRTATMDGRRSLPQRTTVRGGCCRFLAGPVVPALRLQAASMLVRRAWSTRSRTRSMCAGRRGHREAKAIPVTKAHRGIPAHPAAMAATGGRQHLRLSMTGRAAS